MSIEEYIRTLKRIDKLIQIKGTGTPYAFARRIGVSERTLYRYIQQLKAYGADVKYCASRGSYYYGETGSISIAFVKTASMDANHEITPKV